MVMALVVSLEPFRIGMTVVMLNRPRPVLQLATFLAAGFLMGLSVGAVVLFAVGSRLPQSAHLTVPKVQIAIGLVSLIAAAFLATTKARTGHPPAWLTRLLDGQSLWVAGGAGLGIALPSVDYLAALAVIAAAGVPTATQFSALLLFNIVAFALVEIPLLAYLIAPDRTRSAMTRFHSWIRTRPRRGVAGVLAVLGAVLVTAGVLGA